MFKRPWFWFAFVFLAILAVLFNLRYADKALNILNIQISMSRKESLAEAVNLHNRLGVKFEGYRQATVFNSDSEFQNYVELRAGGKQAFEKILSSDDYYPYYWYVRHFKEGEARELVSYFSPAGKVIGFEEKVPESEPGKALSRLEATALADSIARTQWSVALDQYTLIQEAQEARPNGRIDHTFTYEHRELKYNEALIRLELIVTGDRLTTIRPFHKIPEQFSKDYAAMRSYNEILAGIASALMLLLYGIAMIVWLFLLLRRRQLIWKPALMWAILIGIFMFFAGLNFISFQWLGYDTSTSSSSFLTQQILQNIFQGLLLAAISFITFLVAEAVTREAMPQEVQFWKSFSRDTAPTKSVLGKVLGGYLFMPIELAYVIGFYYFTQSRWGWWSPASSFSDPNILGAAMPWVTAIGQALQAGFWEEAMFRALPLATMLIIGTKLNKKKLFLILGIILQAFIFSAAHAGYAQQPFYARMVELSITSVIMAFIYLRFGLLPAIIWHFSFDALLMNLSSFVTKSADLIPDRIIFSIFFLLPLLIILWRKAQATMAGEAKFTLGNWLFRGWQEVPQSSLNAAWKPDELVSIEPAPQEMQAEIPIVVPETHKSSKSGYAFKPWMGIFFSLVVLLVLIVGSGLDRSTYLKQAVNGVEQTFKHVRPRLQISAEQAIQYADEALLQQLGKALPPAYKAYPNIERSNRDKRHFILKHSSYAAYAKLRNKYIYEDAWLVKYKRFEGTLQERTEEYHVMLDSAGKLLAIQHLLSEDTALPSLDEAAARARALEWVNAHEPGILSLLKEISVVPSKLPNRTDWTFTWNDTSDYLLKSGQTRLKIVISGDQIGQVSRFVFIPEDAQRQIDHSAQLTFPYQLLTTVLSMMFAIAAVIFAVIMWSKGEFDWKIFLLILLIMSSLTVAVALVNWRTQVGEFNTSQPLANQKVGLIIGIVLKSVFLSAAVALINGWGIWWLKHRTGLKNKVSNQSVIYVPVLAVLISLVLTKFRGWELGLLKLPNLQPALALCPGLPVWEQIMFKYFLYSGLILFTLYLLEQITQKGKKRRYIVPIVWLFAGLVISVSQNLLYADPEFIANTLINGLIYGLAGWLIWHYQGLLSAKLWIWCSLILLLIAPAHGIYANAFVNATLAYALSYLGVIMIVLFLTMRLCRIPGKSME